MPGPAAQVSTAREAFARGEWLAARDMLREARSQGELEISDLELLSRSAWFLGDGPESMVESEAVFERLISEDLPTRAAQMALQLALEWATRGDIQVASAWLARADRLLRDQPRGTAVGYLVYLQAGLTLEIEGDPAAAEVAARQVAELAGEFDEPVLWCFSHVLSGLAAVRSGRSSAGFADLDEAMLPVLAGRLDPLWAGDIYCTVIHLCEALGDLARMRAWTDALDRWATPVSRTFMYAGVTRVHQLQLISAEGGWDMVEEELGHRSQELAGSHGWVAGAGYVQLGDVRRLRGDLAGANEAYDLARQLGVEPQPGEAMLLQSEGRTTEALATLRAALGQSGRLERARLLLCATELAVESGEESGAEQLAAELESTAAFYGTPGLLATAHQARAVVLIAADRASEAIEHLEHAAQIYRDQRYRHAMARVYELLALARRALGDTRLAEADEATALAIYRQLGAETDARRLSMPASRPGGLTDREIEVLACVASGASNRDVARKLFISDKTVSRHLANIFLKAGVTSRTAAAAWARENGIDAHGMS